MAYEFKLPDLGEGLTEGEIARWLVQEGQEIAEDDPLVEIQTDKATVDIPSPYAGTVLRIFVAEGEVAPVGAVLVVIGEPGETVPPASVGGHGAAVSPGDDRSVRASQPPGRIQATPVARKVAQELGVDLATLAGSGPSGRITEEDVRTAASGPATHGGTAEGRREPLDRKSVV